MQEITEYIEQELTSLKRGIVATPDEDYLDRFTDANHGSNDFLQCKCQSSTATS
jgi:hypothetical protein